MIKPKYLTLGMFVLCENLSKKVNMELVYYVHKVYFPQKLGTVVYNIKAVTNGGEILSESPNKSEKHIKPFWLQKDEVYRFKEGSVRIYDVYSDSVGDIIIAYKTLNNSSILYVYHFTFIKEFTELIRIDEI